MIFSENGICGGVGKCPIAARFRFFDTKSTSYTSAVTGTVAPNSSSGSVLGAGLSSDVSGGAYQGNGNASFSQDVYSAVDNAVSTNTSTSVVAPSVNIGSPNSGGVSGLFSSDSLLGVSYAGWAAIAAFAGIAFYFLRKH